MSSTSSTAVYVCGAAGLAFWLLVRFPSVGPRSLRSAIVAAAAGALLQWPLLPPLGAAVGATAGPGVGDLFRGPAAPHDSLLVVWLPCAGCRCSYQTLTA